MDSSAKFLHKVSSITFIFFVTLIAFLFFHSSPQAQSEEPTGANVLFILDSSGSMAGQLEGKAKIDVAKEVMTNLVKELPQGVKVGLGNEYDPNAKGTMYYISVEDNFDINTSSDIGDTFEKTLSIEPGTYKGFLAGEWGDDRKDFYSIPLKAEQKVSIKVTPPAEVGYKVSIWDQDRVNVAEKASANPGAIARVSWTAPEEQEEVFLLIEPFKVTDKSTNLPYTIEIKVE